MNKHIKKVWERCGPFGREKGEADGYKVFEVLPCGGAGGKYYPGGKKAVHRPAASEQADPASGGGAGCHFVSALKKRDTADRGGEVPQMVTYLNQLKQIGVF